MLDKGQAGGCRVKQHDLFLQMVSELEHDIVSDLDLNHSLSLLP